MASHHALDNTQAGPRHADEQHRRPVAVCGYPLEHLSCEYGNELVHFRFEGAYVDGENPRAEVGGLVERFHCQLVMAQIAEYQPTSKQQQKAIDVLDTRFLKHIIDLLQEALIGCCEMFASHEIVIGEPCVRGRPDLGLETFHRLVEVPSRYKDLTQQPPGGGQARLGLQSSAQKILCLTHTSFRQSRLRFREMPSSLVL